MPQCSTIYETGAVAGVTSSLWIRTPIVGASTGGPHGPIVAVLPGAARGAARGDGNEYVGLGFDDFACTPITRQNILATIGKYLGFEPITTSTN